MESFKNYMFTSSHLQNSNLARKLTKFLISSQIFITKKKLAHFLRSDEIFALILRGRKPSSIQISTTFECQLQIKQVRLFWKHNTMIHNFSNFHFKIPKIQHTMTSQTFSNLVTRWKTMNSAPFFLHFIF